MNSSQNRCLRVLAYLSQLRDRAYMKIQSNGTHEMQSIDDAAVIIARKVVEEEDAP